MTTTYTFDIQGFIDGRDQLILKGGTLQWHHLDFAAVGRNNGGNRNEPTIITTSLNGATQLDHFDWYPDWPEPPPAEIRYQASSSVFSGLVTPLPSTPVTVTLNPISARDSLNISQYPIASNGYTLILDFNDDQSGGPAWYDALLTVTASDPLPPAVTTSNLTEQPNQTLAASSLFTVSDPNNYTITEYQFWDSTRDPNSGHFYRNGVQQAPGTVIDIPASGLGQLTFVTGTVSNALQVRAFDGTNWSAGDTAAWSPFSINISSSPSAPIVTTANLSEAPNQTFAASSLFTVSDPNGHAITEYQFWDSTRDPNSGHFYRNGVQQAPGTVIDIPASELGQLTFVTGTVSNLLQVRAFDGTNWSAGDTTAWSPFSINISSSSSAPIVTTANLTRQPNQTLAASSLFTASDPNSYAITEYQLWDSTRDPNSGHFYLNGVQQAPGTVIDIPASELGQLTFVTGTVANALQVRAYDGLNWSAADSAAWSPFTIDINTPPPSPPPVVTTSNLTKQPNQTLAAASLFTVSDPNGYAITDYQFWDSTRDPDSGRFYLNGVQQAPGTVIDIPASALGQLTFVTGTVASALQVRAFDGASWSAADSAAWSPFTINAPPPPVVNAPNATLSTRTVAGSSLFTASDPDGDPITTYGIWNLGTGGGRFYLPGGAEPINQEFDVSAAQLSQLSYTSGSGADTFWVRASDGNQWSPWTTRSWITGPVGNITAFTVSLNDPGNLWLDAELITDVDAAAADWAQYLNGIGAVEIQVNIAPTTRANGGPSTVFAAGTDGSRTVYEPAAEHEMLTGHDPNPPDITITIDPTYLQNVTWLNPDPGSPSTVPSDKIDAVSVMRHEIAHGLGIGSYRDKSTGALPAGYEMIWDKLSSIDANGNAWFTGANAEGVYGGPVPITTLQNGEQYSHLGNSANDPIVGQDLMNGVVAYYGRSYGISSLDLAIMRDLGLPITTLTPQPAPVAGVGSGVAALNDAVPVAAVDGAAVVTPAGFASPNIGSLAQHMAASLVALTEGYAPMSAPDPSGGAWGQNPALSIPSMPGA